MMLSPWHILLDDSSSWLLRVPFAGVIAALGQMSIRDDVEALFQEWAMTLSSLEVERRPSRSGSGESRVVLDRQSNSGDQYLGRSFTIGGRKHDEWAGQPCQVRTSGCFKRQRLLHQ